MIVCEQRNLHGFQAGRGALLPSTCGLQPRNLPPWYIRHESHGFLHHDMSQEPSGHRVHPGHHHVHLRHGRHDHGHGEHVHLASSKQPY